jgi:hypothetical protein
MIKDSPSRSCLVLFTSQSPDLQMALYWEVGLQIWERGTIYPIAALVCLIYHLSFPLLSPFLAIYESHLSLSTKTIGI